MSGKRRGRGKKGRVAVGEEVGGKTEEAWLLVPTLALPRMRASD